MSDVCVVGLGRIGLPVAVSLAYAGHNVLGVDTNPEVVSAINKGVALFDEPRLPEMLASVVAGGTFKAAAAPAASKVFIISVPTPVAEDKKPVLDYVNAAASAVGGVLRSGDLVVLESTVPPGTTSGTFRNALEKASGLYAGSDFLLAHCPERVLPGDVIREIEEADRIVGGIDLASTAAAAELYRSFVKGEIAETDDRTAELAKLAENIYRDVNIGLANELAALTERLDADVWRVIELANLHPRVNIHSPGPGVGGYCIPVASRFLLSDLDVDAPVIESARAVNENQPSRVVDRAMKLLKGIPDPSIALLGVAYKGGVGDARDSPASDLIELFKARGVTVRAHDPLVTRYRYPLDSLEGALRGADLVLIVADHAEFADLDPASAANLMRGSVAIDTRNLLPVERWAAAGFKVITLGVGTTGSG